VRESINEMEKIQNVNLVFSDHNPSLSETEKWKVYEEKTKWNDFNIGVPVLFNYYHGLELLMKGLLQEVHVKPEKQNHKLTDYFNQIVENKSKFSTKIIDNLKTFLLQDNPFEMFFTDNNGSVDDFYIMLRYPAPVKENSHYVFGHIRGSDKQGLDKWLSLRNNTIEIKKAIEQWKENAT
jgi:hypothetical protein